MRTEHRRLGRAWRGLLVGLAAWAWAGPVGAAPEPAPSGERLRLPVSLYTEDLSRWTPARVDEAMALGARYLAPCGIDLEWAPVEALLPGAEFAPERLWRTRRGEEVVILLRAQGDRRHYRLGGVVNFWRRQGRWLGEGPFGPVALALAQEIGRGKLRHWPKPTGPDAGEAIAKARLALMFAVGMGWITLEPAVSARHCAFLKARFEKLQRLPPSRPDPFGRVRLPLAFEGPPQGLLVADVPNRDGLQVVVRGADSWRIYTVRRGFAARLAPRPKGAGGGEEPPWPPTLEAHPVRLPAVGTGEALLRIGGALLLLSRPPAGGVYQVWGHTQAGRRAAFRPDGPLAGCARLLAADALSPAADADQGDPGVAVVVCPDRVAQLGPLPAWPERTDRLPTMDWATLTRLGPGRLRLLAGRAGVAASYELWPGYPPREVPVDPEVAALVRARPQAPVWHALGVAPVQLAEGKIIGPGGARPLGAGATVRFNPQRYQVVRVKGAEARVDDLFAGPRHQVRLPAGAHFATQRGAVGPQLWILGPGPDGGLWLEGVGEDEPKAPPGTIPARWPQGAAPPSGPPASAPASAVKRATKALGATAQ